MQPFCCRADTKSPLSVSVIPVILTANYVTDDLKMAMFCISDSKLTRTDILVFDFLKFWFLKFFCCCCFFSAAILDRRQDLAKLSSKSTTQVKICVEGSKFRRILVQRDFRSLSSKTMLFTSVHFPPIASYSLIFLGNPNREGLFSIRSLVVGIKENILFFRQLSA